MVKMLVNRKAGFSEAGGPAGEGTGSIRPMGMVVDKPEEEDASKYDDEDPRPEDRSAGAEKGGARGARVDPHSVQSLVPVLCDGIRASMRTNPTR